MPALAPELKPVLVSDGEEDDVREVARDEVGDEVCEDVVVVLLPVEAGSETLDVAVEMMEPSALTVSFVRLNHILSPEVNVAPFL